MHVNETIRNESKTCRKTKGGTYKMYIISAAKGHIILNLESNLCSDVVHLPKGHICKLSNSNAHEY